MNHKKLSAFIVLASIAIFAVVIGLYANTANTATPTQPTVETQKPTQANTNPTIYKIVFADNESAEYKKTVEIYWKPQNSSIIVADVTINRNRPWVFQQTNTSVIVPLNWQYYTVYTLGLGFDDGQTLWYVNATATPT